MIMVRRLDYRIFSAATVPVLTVRLFEQGLGIVWERAFTSESEAISHCHIPGPFSAFCTGQYVLYIRTIGDDMDKDQMRCL